MLFAGHRCRSRRTGRRRPGCGSPGGVGGAAADGALDGAVYGRGCKGVRKLLQGWASGEGLHVLQTVHGRQEALRDLPAPGLDTDNSAGESLPSCLPQSRGRGGSWTDVLLGVERYSQGFGVGNDTDKVVKLCMVAKAEELLEDNSTHLPNADL